MINCSFEGSAQNKRANTILLQENTHTVRKVYVLFNSRLLCVIVNGIGEGYTVYYSNSKLITFYA